MQKSSKFYVAALIFQQNICVKTQKQRLNCIGLNSHCLDWLLDSQMSVGECIGGRR